MKRGEECRVPKSHCLNCGYELDAATCMEEGKPPARPGDLSICLQCGWLSVFDKKLRLRAPNADEMIGAMTDVRVLLAVGHITERNRKAGREFPMRGTPQ